jgi:hypothetical protein
MLNEIRRFAETVEHNLCDDPGPGGGRIHRWAQCASLDPKEIPEVQRFIRLNGQTFLDAVDEKLGSCALKGNNKHGGVRCGVGIYAFADDGKLIDGGRVPRRIQRS